MASLKVFLIWYVLGSLSTQVNESLVRWRRQDRAVTGRFTLASGGKANVVLVAGREAERSAVLVIPQPGGGQPKTLLLSEAHDQIAPADLVEILCMQERCFGSLGLPVPEEFAP